MNKTGAPMAQIIACIRRFDLRRVRLGYIR
jgi:hypothetical protein